MSPEQKAKWKVESDKLNQIDKDAREAKQRAMNGGYPTVIDLQTDGDATVDEELREAL